MLRSWTLIFTAIIAVTMSAIDFPNGAIALILVLLLASPFLLVFRKISTDHEFLTDIFLIALVARLSLGIFIEILNLRSLAGPDANGYDQVAVWLIEYWNGTRLLVIVVQFALLRSGANWGMNYLVAGLCVIGPNIFAKQSACVVFGAATPPLALSLFVEGFQKPRCCSVHGHRLGGGSGVHIVVGPAFERRTDRLFAGAGDLYGDAASGTVQLAGCCGTYGINGGCHGPAILYLLYDRRCCGGQLCGRFGDNEQLNAAADRRTGRDRVWPDIFWGNENGQYES